MLKMPMEEIIGQSLEKFVRQSDHKNMAALLVSTQVKPSRKQLLFVAADGTLVPARVSANLLQQGDFVSICMVAMDMTELEASEEIIRQIQEQKEALEKNAAALRDSRRAALNIMEDALAARQQAEALNVELRREVRDRKLAEEALRKAHDELDTRVKERTAELGEMVLELQKQIVQRVRAEEAFRSASLYARGLLEAALDPFVTISPEGKITDINRATELVTGLSREDLIGSDFSDYFTEPQKAKEVYKKVLTAGIVKDYSLTIRHVSGHTTDVLYNATLYKNEAGQVQGVLAAARDVTEHNIMESRNRFTNVLLELFAQKTSRKEYLDSVVRAIRDWSGCQCVGIRLTNSEGFHTIRIPYRFQRRIRGVREQALPENRRLCLYPRHHAITRTTGCASSHIQRVFPQQQHF